MDPRLSPLNPPLPGGPAESSSAAPLATPDLNALAQVTSGVAPVLNNLLAIITGRTERLLDDETMDRQTRESLREIYSAGESAVSLVRQLLYFCGDTEPLLRLLHLNNLIEQSGETLYRLLGPRIALEFRLAPDLRLVSADADMIEQALIGLVLNARDAMPDGGRLTVTTVTEHWSEPDALAHPDGRPGSFVTLGVADTGGGVAPEILAHLCEPFATTKPAGHGAGLGLAAIHGIVRKHHGWLAVKSTPGAGTEFKVFLPAAAADAVPDEPPLVTVKPGGGHEPILVVEDDVPTRELTVAVLQGYGYRVLQAGTMAEALEVWKWHGAHIKLLLTDVVLDGHRSGLDLIAKLRAAKPDLAVLCSSGHGRAIFGPSTALPAGVHFLQKPCRAETLAHTIRALLDASSPP